MIRRMLFNSWKYGSAFHSINPSKAIFVFFSANKKTCIEWISRLKVTVMFLAFKLDDFHYVAREGQDTLPYLLAHNDNEEFDEGVQRYAIALSKLKASKELRGLFLWCKERAYAKYHWIDLLIELVDGRIETCLKLLYKVSPIPGIIMNFIEEAIHYEYLSQIEEYKKKAMNEEMLINRDYWQLLSSFNDGVIPSHLHSDLKDPMIKDTMTSLIEILNYANCKLMEAAIQFQNYSTTWTDNSMLYESLKCANDKLLILSNINQLTGDLRKKVMILRLVCREMENLLHKDGCLLDRLLMRDKNTDLSSLIMIKKWGDFFVRQHSYPEDTLYLLHNLNLNIAKRARKDQNYFLSEKYLAHTLQCSYGRVFDHIEELKYDNVFLTPEKASCLREAAKLAKVKKMDVLAVKTLIGIIVGVGTTFFPNTENKELFCVSSKCIKDLFIWFTNDIKLMDLTFENSSSVDFCHGTLNGVLEMERDVGGPVCELHHSNVLSSHDAIMGRLLRLSINHSPNVGKLWGTFANWSFEMGEKILHQYNNTCIELSVDEKNTIDNCGFDSKTKHEIIGLLCQPRLIPKTTVDSGKLEYMKKQLLTVKNLSNIDDILIEDILKVWQSIQRRTYFYFDMATTAYFQFISYVQDQSKIISATLRILQLIVKYAVELQESLQSGLETTPCDRWLPIIPQLFSRLNHPVKLVRNRLIELLNRLAEDNSQTIIYPAIVGSLTNDKMDKLLALNNDCMYGKNDSRQDMDYAMKSELNPELMQNAHAQIVEVLRKKSSFSVDQIHSFIMELQRISLLWNEIWLGTLQQYNNEINKRIKRLEDELAVLQNNSSLSCEEINSLLKDKYNIIFKPILFVFEKIAISTSVPPETPHEEWFSNLYGEFINNMIKNLSNPGDPSKPKEVWALVDKLQLNLLSTRKNNLKISDVSSYLKKIRQTQIPMPGICGLTVDSCDVELNILLTKTRPKKLWLRGSDGRRYGFLLKGLEDLHLDERIMQFLSITNCMMEKNIARHYSVVPLGSRSGLIQWVEGAYPIFALYKKWQQRPLIGNDLHKNINLQKPSEMFYSKLIPLLREKGITNFDIRKDWPIQCLKDVLSQLLLETPDDLLYSEILFASSSPKHWYDLTRNLTKSFAIMSVIGYIIGLGDRHLDNLLVDFSSGEVIHIDYNVCFEKGKNLRIPEKVPCRLTQNIIKVFGVTGVEGNFRSTCEETLMSLRSGKETLLTLLEAFVYDPLVDWTPGIDSLLFNTVNDFKEKKDLQTEITFSMYSVRVAEMKMAWYENKLDLLNILSNLEESLGLCIDNIGKTKTLREDLSTMHINMSLLKEAETNPCHKLYAAQKNFHGYKLIEQTLEDFLIKVSSFKSEMEKWQTLYQRTFFHTFSIQLNKWNEELIDIKYSNVMTAIISMFLVNAGQPQLIKQGEEVEINFMNHFLQVKDHLQMCLQLLGHFSNVFTLLPTSYKKHLTSLCVNLVDNLTCDLNMNICDKISQEFESFLQNKESNNTRIISYGHSLEERIQEINAKFEEINSQILLHGNSSILLKSSLLLKDEIRKQSENNKYEYLILSIKCLSNIHDEIENLEYDLRDNSTKKTSTNGKWFVLDKVIMKVDLVVNWIEFVKDIESQENSSNILKKFFLLIKQLQHFKSSYYAIILQEGIKLHQKDDASILEIRSKFDEVIGKNITELETIIGNLKLLSRFSLNEIDENNEWFILARQLQNRYNTFMDLISCKANDSLNSGQLLLVALNSLFIHIDTCFKELNEIEITLFSDFDINILITFLNRVIFIKQYLEICHQCTVGIKEDNKEDIIFPQTEHVTMSVNWFIADFYCRNFCGFFSKELKKFIMEMMQRIGNKFNYDDLNQDVFSQFNNIKINEECCSIMADFSESINKLVVSKSLEQMANELQAIRQICQGQFNTFQWLYEDIYPNKKLSLRTNFIMELKQCVETLCLKQSEFTHQKESYEEFYKIVEQRLMWGCAANPELKNALDLYLTSFNKQIESASTLRFILKCITSFSNAIIHYETLRFPNSPEAISLITSFRCLIHEAKKVANLKNENSLLSPQEISLFSLNPPLHNGFESSWIKNTEELITEKIKKIQMELLQESNVATGHSKSLREKFALLREVVIKHHQLLSDVIVLLKMMDKAEDYDIPQVSHYLSIHKTFSDLTSSVIDNFQGDESMNDLTMKSIIRNIDLLKNSTTQVYEEVLNISHAFKDGNLEFYKTKKECKRSTTDSQFEENYENMEVKNSFAIHVLRRIRMKLEGREPDSLRRATEFEQVDYILKEAMSHDNLALMYEGWTAWI